MKGSSFVPSSIEFTLDTYTYEVRTTSPLLETVADPISIAVAFPSRSICRIFGSELSHTAFELISS